MVTLRDIALKNNTNIGYDAGTKNVTVGQRVYTPDQLKQQGLTLTDGRWSGEESSIRSIIEGNQNQTPTPTVVPAPTTATSSTPAQAPPQTPVNDLASMITNQLSQLTTAQVNALKNRIAQSTMAQKQIISNAPKESAPLIAQSELRKAEELRSTLERNANLGDRGGVGRQAALETQLAGDARLNDIKLREQSVIDNANMEIARLEAEGLYEEASIMAQNKAEELRLLRDEALRLQGIEREDAIRAEDIAREDAQIAKQDTEAANLRERTDFQTTISANFSNIQGLIDQLISQNAPQWKIDMAKAAREQKKAEFGLDDQGRPIVDTAAQNEAIRAFALKKWDSGIPLSPQEQQALGVSVAVKPKTSTGSGGGTTVTQDRNFQKDRWEILGVADDAISKAWGVPVGTKYNPNTPTEPVDIKPYRDYVESYFTTEDDTGRKSVNRGQLIPYLIQLDRGGASDAAIALSNFYGVTEQEIENIERVMGGSTKR